MNSGSIYKENVSPTECLRTFSGDPVGTLAQLVEHRTENPGVPSSILGGTTKIKA